MATAISANPTTPSTTSTSSKQPASLTQGPGGAMGKDQFLQLFVAQMKNQDPLSPMDGTAMAAQLAQFSSVEQLTQMNETLSTEATGQTGLATLLANNGALGAVGKNVLVSAASVDTTKSAPTAITVDIPSGTTGATLKIYDASGNEVASQDLGAPSAGRHTFDLTGNAKAPGAGTYKYVVETPGAQSETVTPQIAGHIDSVRFTSNGPVISMGGVEVPYMSVTEITN